MSTNGWMSAVGRVTERIWFRLTLFGVVAILLALLARLVGELVPGSITIDFGQDSVSGILQILATSMLAVTTFSLTAMISAYASASAGTTPRATQLLIADRTSQNALSTFLGSFVFAIVGIVALSTSYYGESGRTVLYVGTLVVIALIVVTLMRWIHHLTEFGRMADVIDRVERAATDAACEHARSPHLGGAPPVEIPAAARPLAASRAGCVTGIDMAELATICDSARLTVHVHALPGAAVGLGRPLATVEGTADEATVERLRGVFRIEDHRTYEQDPRLGYVALAEIGSRALSPSTNDPGSAIEALNAIQRVLTRMLTTTTTDAEVRHPRVHVPTVTLEDIVEDALRPLARDGAAVVEVGLRIQRVIGDIIGIVSADDASVLRKASTRAERRAVGGLADAGDQELVTAAALEVRAREAGSALHP
ncbi:DUF2254 domain-containing protein [Demequina activiva]|uniref:DUF2254 domain-containing protein n=1 Tax=Demequina activiva TaxID=1582364 RepID=A0A919UK46_9MICO|nr:DUF2254 domain-containing protein [Demequina activiva]GIG54535.1 hypothetical protein Dac01nite_12870 [Demequina activiva]